MDSNHTSIDLKSLAASAIGKPFKDKDGNVIGHVVAAAVFTEGIKCSIKLDDGRHFSTPLFTLNDHG